MLMMIVLSEPSKVGGELRLILCLLITFQPSAYCPDLAAEGAGILGRDLKQSVLMPGEDDPP
jgi:hypothetical protein